MRIALLLFTFALTACKADSDDSEVDPPADLDQDGFSTVDDCDDADPDVHPGAAEFCDGVDQDCDQVLDDDAIDTTLFFPDADADGFGSVGPAEAACTSPAGYSANDDDCDDDDAAVNPDAIERCDEADVDEDCDGSADGADAQGATTWYPDLDGDGFGNTALGEVRCDALGDVDLDGDCDDTQIAVNPAAIEVCGGFDDDCDGQVDEDAVDAQIFHADLDHDGFGDAGNSALACTAPPDHVSDATDCDDAHAQSRPGAPEQCDGLDNDCDGSVDDEVIYVDWYVDADGDGFGDPGAAAVNACLAPVGRIDNDDDCADADHTRYPGAAEVCDAIDQDCDGAADDDAIDAATFFVDADGDGVGDSGSSLRACSAPDGTVAIGQDCDDGDAAVFPGAAEACDSLDNDCDGQIDDVSSPVWFRDADADGFGAPNNSRAACTAPSGYVADSTDCDDTRGTSNPAASEICGGLDDDCDGHIDDADSSVTGTTVWYADADDDDFGDAGTTRSACTRPSGYVADSTDCDESNRLTNPDAASDPRDGLDNDCDGATDEDGAVDYATDIQPIWTQYCTRCHGGAHPSGSLDLNAGTGALVGVPSSDVRTEDRVVPGSTDDSYLWLKLEGRQSEVGGRGGRMPSSAGLPDDELLPIQAWILDGANP